MQVDPKPSPWPCAVMLVGLLLFCLTVPRYWQSQGQPTTVSKAATGESHDGRVPRILLGPRPLILSSESGTAGGFTIGQSSERSRWGISLDSLSLCQPPTIEELIETAKYRSSQFDMSAATRSNAFGGLTVFGPPMGIFDPSSPPSHQSELESRVVPSGLITAVIERIGRAMVEYSAADLIRPLLSYASRLHEGWALKPGMAAEPEPQEPIASPPGPAVSPLASTLRLVSPGDRLAMRPPQTADAPKASQPEFRQPEIARSDKSAEPSTEQPALTWCVPHVLLQQLERLACHPQSAEWAQNTLGQLRALTQGDRVDSNEAASLLGGLKSSTQQARRLADGTSDDALRVELLRAHWALARRLDCWTVMYDIRIAEHAGARFASRGSLSSLFQGVSANDGQLTNEAVLNIELEHYEQTRDPHVARKLAQRRQALEASPDSLDQSLAEAVEQHYRNANVRVAVTSEVLNRLAGQERSEARLVRDRIAGTPVRGHSHVHSQSSIHLEPASGRWQLDVESQGVVESRTLADGGRARLRSVGATDFTAQKTVIVDTNGVRLEPTVVEATNHNRLVGVTTDFDWVPLVGSYARNQAIRQYRAKRSRARAEVENKVAARAIEQMDRETLDAVDRLENDLRHRFLDPMTRFGIELTPIELTTTQKRLVARVRVAGDHQLGGHTPRPQALSDSLASLQMHETALTNAAVSLGLDGRRLSAPELRALLREKFPKLAEQNAPVARRDTVFEFNDRDAVRFSFDGGRMEIMLSMVGLEHQGRATGSFIVHAFYVPMLDGLTVELARDGPLGFEGRLSSSDRARLHNIFGSVLSQERRLPILRLEEATESRLEGLTITQLVLEDGWLGMAIGPGGAQRVAERTRSMR